MAATRLFESLELGDTLSVPVFDVVRAKGIWLMTQPMEWGVYGFSLVEGPARGILLNSNHSEPMQRFTCAHELGHLELGHVVSVDHAADVDNSLGGSLQETQAQAFASSFIMPVRNVYRAMSALAVDEDQVSPQDVYLLSRTLDVSFAAMCWRLVELELIGRETALRWVRRGPRGAKSPLVGIPAELDYTVITPGLIADPIFGREGEYLVVEFEDRSDAGYVWRLEGDTSGGPELVWDGADEIRSSPVVRPDATTADSRPSGPTLELEGRGDATVALELARPWQADSTAARVELQVTIKPPHEITALHESQRPLARGPVD